MPGIDFPSRSVSLPVWWKPVSVITVGGLLAFTLWTVPNWGEFWSNVSQFPTLWQIPTNRGIIISLTIKIVSPVLIMGILWMVVCISSLIQSFQDDEVVDGVGRQQAQLGEQREKMRRDVFPPMPEQEPKRHDVSFSPQSLVLPASVSWHHDPVTPIPPTLSLSEALRQQGDGSNNAVIHSTDEQQASLADQQDENSAAGATVSTSIALPTSNVSQPVALTSEQIASPNPLISI